MRQKIYLLLITVLLAGSMLAETVTLTMSDYAATEFTASGITVSTAKNGGASVPAYNSGGQDLRIYAQGSVTISAEQAITAISFTISTQGKKRLASLTADVGSMTVAGSPDFTVAWSGSANSVTITVGDKADNGTDGNTKAGQFDFSAITVTLGEGDPVASTIWHEIAFTEEDLATTGTLDGHIYYAPTNTDFTLTVTDENGKASVDANVAKFGTGSTHQSYTHRYKTGGKSGAQNALTLNIPTSGMLRVAARTSSNTATDRTLVITQSGQELYNQIVQETDQMTVDGITYYPYIMVPVEAGTVEVNYPIGGLNFYSFSYKQTAETGTTIRFIPSAWQTDGAKYAAWIWGATIGDGVNGVWTEFFRGSGDTLSLTITEQPEYIIFVRFAESVSEPTWNNYEIQTADIEMNYNSLLYIITSGNAGRWIVPCPAADSFPWEQNFEDMDANIVPDCWDNSGSTSSTVTSYPSRIWGVYSYNSNKMLRMYNYSVNSGDALINTPSVALPAEPAYELTFDYAHTASCGNFIVKISEDSGSSWTNLQSYSKGSGSNSSNPGEFTEALINLAAYAGKTVMFQFYAYANYGSGAIFVDNISVHEAPPCAKPVSLSVSDVAPHGATLAWTSSATQWQICLNEDEDNLITVSENPYTLMSLPPVTAFSAKVRAVCGEEYSEWSNNVNFTTLVACHVPTGLEAVLTPGNGSVAMLNWSAGAGETAFVVQYGTDDTFAQFEEINVTATTLNLSGLIAGTVYYARVKAVCGEEDGDSDWSEAISFRPTDYQLLLINEGTKTNGYVPIYGYYTDDITKSQFIIPAADLASIEWDTIHQLTFFASNTNVSWPGAEFEVYITETVQTTLDELQDYALMNKVMNSASLSIVKNQMVVSFDAPYQYQGRNLLIGFLQTQTGSYSTSSWYGVTATGASLGGRQSSINQQNFLPKMEIGYRPSTVPGCKKPIGLSVDESTITDASVSLDWTAGSETAWQIVYSTDAAFDPDATTSVSVNAHPAVLDNLTENTLYYWCVRADCGENGTSEWSNKHSFTTLRTCQLPSNLTASNILHQEATISWDLNEQSLFNLRYSTDGTNWTVETEVTAPFTMTGLTAATTYQVQVQAICNGEDWSETISFKTAYAMPFAEAFANSGLPTDWTRYSGLLNENVLNGTTALSANSSGWSFGTNNGVFDNHTMVNLYGSSCRYWLVMPPVSIVDNVELSFDMALTAYYGTLAAPDESGSDDRFVVLASTDDGATWTILRQWDNAGSEYVLNAIACTAIGEEVLIDLSSYAGQSVKIAFYGESTYSNADNNLHIDNVRIDYRPDCPKPTGLTVNEAAITTSSAEMSWVAGGSETAWKVQYKQADASEWITLSEPVTANLLVLTNLVPATAYEVRVAAWCDPAEETASSEFCYPKQFVTACLPVTTFPWTENFDNLSAPSSNPTARVLPLCWKAIHTTTYSNYKYYPSAYNGSSYAQSNYNSLRFMSAYSNDPQDQYAILPEMEGISGLRITLYARKNSTSYDGTFSVGVMTDPADPDSFEPIATFAPESNAYEKFVALFNNYAGEGRHIAIKVDAATSTNRGLYIDDITVDELPACIEPMSLAVTDGSITTHSAQLSWEANSGESAWKIQYKKSSETEWTDLGEEVSVNPYVLDNLSPYTSYDVRVAAVCGPNFGSNYSDSIRFKTLPGIPFLEEFASLPDEWTRYSGLLNESVLDGTTPLSTTSSGWNVGSSNGVFDSHARVNIYSAYKYWLVSPAITLENDVELTFDMALTSYYGTLAAPDESGSDDKFVVLASTDDGATWTILRQWDNAGSMYVYNDITCSSTGEDVAIDLTAYTGQSVKIAFYGESTESNADNNLHIDNVRIDVPQIITGEYGLSVNGEFVAGTVNPYYSGIGKEWVVNAQLVRGDTIQICDQESSICSLMDIDQKGYHNFTIDPATNAYVVNETFNYTFNIRVKPNDSIVRVATTELDPIPLSINRIPNVVSEGETVQVLLRADNAFRAARTVTIWLSDNMLTAPATVIIPAGIDSCLFDLTVTNDDVINCTRNAYLRAYDELGQGESDEFVIADNDIPEISLTLSELTLDENAGYNALTATIHRNTVTDKAITIYLSDAWVGTYHTSAIYYPQGQTYWFAAGQTEAIIPLGIRDNVKAEGDYQVRLSASMNTSCPEEGGYDEKVITIIDNDVPTLTLSISNSMLLEGKENAASLTVTRNTPTDTAMTASLSVDNADGLIFPSTITIPQGEESVTVTIGVERNDIPDDSHNIIFTAECAGFETATCYAMKIDQTLPDAVVSILPLASVEAEVNTSVSMTLEVTNIGAAGLAKGIQVSLYSSYAAAPVQQFSLPTTLPINGTAQFEAVVTLPSTVGRYSFYAVVNENRQVKELHTDNNKSATVRIQATAPFAVEQVTVDKQAYMPGENIVISGHIAGSLAVNAEVEIYVMNKGWRDAFTLTTDANGDFSTVYTPLSGQTGHFAIGACYPSERSTTEMAGADFYAMELAYSPTTCQISTGIPYEGKFYVYNTGALPLHNVTATVVENNTNGVITLNSISTIQANDAQAITFTLNSPEASVGSDWETITLNITCDETLETNGTIYFYCRDPRGQLVASENEIRTNVSYADTAKYIFFLRNSGLGESGQITIESPEWMQVVGSKNLPSIASGEFVQVNLKMIPNELFEANVNVPITGYIGINAANSSGLRIPYTITPVSNAIGRLKVDVCDENTYYTEEHPHLANAQVLVKNINTGAVLSQGLTSANGLYEIDIPEGYYTIAISANDHDAYTNTVYVQPATENAITVNLSIRAITIDWQVVETEVEDEYEIITTVKYETQVPKPVVVIDAPSKIEADELAEGESLMYNVTITNKGLIRAEDVTITLPDGGSDFVFEALAYGEPFNLDAQQSVVMPVRVTRASKPNYAPRRARKIHGIIECSDNMLTLYYWDCGTDRKWHQYGVPLVYAKCDGGGNTVTNITTTQSSGVWIPYIPWSWPIYGPGGTVSGPYYDYNEHVDPPLIYIDEGCEPCQNQFLLKAVKCALSFTPVGDVLDNVKLIADCYTAVRQNYDETNDVVSATLAGLEVVAEPVLDKISEATGDNDLVNEVIDDAIDIVDDVIDDVIDDMIDNLNQAPAQVKAASGAKGKLKNIVECLKDFMAPCEHTAENAASAPARYGESKNQETDEYEGEPEYLARFKRRAKVAHDEIIYSQKYVNLYFEPSMQAYMSNSEMADLFTAWKLALAGTLDENILNVYRPAALPDDLWAQLIQRMNNTYNYMHGIGNVTTNFAHPDSALFYMQQIAACEQMAVECGYTSAAQMYDAEYELLENRLNNKSSNVCATITLQFEQKMVMTRQAFRGTLTVFNGHETTAMTDIHLNLSIYDEFGNVATDHEFQTNLENLQGMEGEMSLNAENGWTIGSQETGVATVLFIPTKFAAPTQEVTYSFGGQLSYTDPFSGLTVTRDLYPVQLVVKPSPQLELTYFMQRDVFSDDPLTENVTEPAQPTEFALLINNKGYGDANNVRMTTKEPQIVDNEKGLLIDFYLLHALVNGQQKSVPIDEEIMTDFGTIAAHNQLYAQWFFESTLLGHFIEYDVAYTHLTSYDNPNLSLIDTVHIHEMIHSISVPSSEPTHVGWLANDQEDIADLPDALYVSDGSILDLHHALSIQIAPVDAHSCTLTFVPSASGWNYGTVAAQAYSWQDISRVTRLSDNAEISLRNVWQTPCVLTDGSDPIHLNRIHIADNIESTTSYRIEFTDKVIDPTYRLSYMVDGEEYAYDSLEYFSEITLLPEPTREGYTFSGWQNVIEFMPEHNDTIYGFFTPNRYAISFLNYDGVELQSDSMEYGQMPAYIGATPVKPANVQYTYTFKGWSPEVVTVSGDAVYTAEYDSVVNSYTIIFLNDDGTELCHDEWLYGEIPSCEEPEKPEDDLYWYSFVSWSPEVLPVNGEAVYVAVYNAIDKHGTTTSIDIISSTASAKKIMIDNKIYILRGDKTYTATGQLVK